MAQAATRGPVPKRSTERRRRNKDSAPTTVEVIAAAPVKPPEPDPGWDPIATEWFLSLRDSGQSQFYEPSDWQAARYVAHVMSRNLLAEKKFSAVLFAAVWAAMNDLLSTEASRRRVRMEIERDDPVQPAGVTALADYRKSLGVGVTKPKRAAVKKTTAKKKSASRGSRAKK